MDDDQDALAEITKMYERGWLERYQNYQEVVDALGVKPVLSKLGIIEKISSGKLKRRVIVDSKRSGVSAAARKPERIVLPRIQDLVDNTLKQMIVAKDRNDDDMTSEWVVIDFSDAFFIVPLAKAERKRASVAAASRSAFKMKKLSLSTRLTAECRPSTRSILS